MSHHHHKNSSKRKHDDKKPDDKKQALPKLAPANKPKIDVRKMAGGKLPPKIDKRTLQFAKYVRSPGAPVDVGAAAPLPQPPASQDWISACNNYFGMMGNDTYNNCAFAAAGHCMQVWSANANTERTIADADISNAYTAFAGPVTTNVPWTNTPKGPPLVELSVLSHWKNIGIDGDQINSYLAITPTNTAYIKTAIYWFGGVYVGIDLPMTAYNQYSNGPWTGPGDTGFTALQGSSAAGSWGGHAVVIAAYDTTGLTCITWGATQRMTWSFFNTYCDEAYALLSQDWIKTVSGLSPLGNGFDMAGLTADLANL